MHLGRLTVLDIVTRANYRVKNGSPRAYVLCRPYWSYSWISDDPQAPSPGEAKASVCTAAAMMSMIPSGCFCRVRAGFDSYEVAEAGSTTAALAVDVEVRLIREGP